MFHVAVSIAPHAEAISPLLLGNRKDIDELDLDRSSSGPRQHVAKGPGSKRLSGRRSNPPSVTSLQSIVESGDGHVDDESRPSTSEAHHHLFSGGLVGQVTAWMREERSRRAARRAKRNAKAAARHVRAESGATHHETDGLERISSSSSEDSIHLERLEQILKESLSFERPSKRRSSLIHRRRPSVKSLHKSSNAGVTGASSDTDWFDGDVLVPSAEAWLDNTKTLTTPGGNASTDELANLENSKSFQAWATFKYEIVRLTHTLRLKGWRRVPMELSNEIDVERLSGALTNAVYVVSPPMSLPQPEATDDKPKVQRPQPPKLLLRIYGPQVEHLIDREAELQILRRLARKRIGPRMLGTFSNGRFEEFFHARTLTPSDLRNPDTSRHIAKRMRELHEGVELLESERIAGPFVWKNWDKWLQRAGNVASWLDQEVQRNAQSDSSATVDAWKTRGYVCGTEWVVFKRTLEKYREWLERQYPKSNQLRERLVFAHNDVSTCFPVHITKLTSSQTQYGNILRLLPAGTSPLLLPANTHKQLVVIDFEYACANTPGLEFANHFTEWCYNYHDPATSWKCNTSVYPKPQEQDRFIRAYVRHRPQFNVSTPKLTPFTFPEPSAGEATAVTPKRPSGPTSSISNFMLDARAPAGSTDSSSLQKIDDETSADEDAEVAALLHETRLWRMANTAQWVAWGIVQAKVPDLPDFSAATTPLVVGSPVVQNATSIVDGDNNDSGERDGGAPQHGGALVTEEFKAEIAALKADIHAKRPDPAEENDEQAEEEFDYLRYARDRAMFFWGDAVKLGIIGEEELPESVRRELKTIDY